MGIGYFYNIDVDEAIRSKILEKQTNLKPRWKRQRTLVLGWSD